MAQRAELEKVEKTALAQSLLQLGRAARAAATKMMEASSEQKNTALHAMANHLRSDKEDIISANQQDIQLAQNRLTAAKIDRLALDEPRIEAMAQGLEAIAALADPIGTEIASWKQPNGLAIERRRTPLGVIGVIFESRPNVNADAGGLCLKAGNAVILRPGSESAKSSTQIHACLQQGLEAASLPQAAITLAPLGDRKVVSHMLSGLEGHIDVIVPRGGRSLVERVQNEARVPIFAHLEGICHIYVDHEANLEMAKAIAVNAKMRRTGICGAAETLLIDEQCENGMISEIIQALIAAQCEVRGDSAIQKLNKHVKPASKQDWHTEYLDAIISIKRVGGVLGAIDHIAHYGSDHTETIITDNQTTADIFLNKVDSAIVMHNASTQFADGGEFGMGAEIGIATGRFHARGPVGVEQLTSFKYIVRGHGHCRP